MSQIFYRDPLTNENIRVGPEAPLPTTVDGITGVNPSSPTVYNVTLTSADTEYPLPLPATCKRLEFQARTAAVVRFAFVVGKVATPTAPYMTLKAEDYYYSDLLDAENENGKKPDVIYLASPTAATVVEALVWE